ncbi:hypothetical protein GGI43DRAFT_432790 [Trichoderma evansii]
MDAPTTDQLISPWSSPPKSVCRENLGLDLVQPEEHGSNTELFGPNTHCVTLNEPSIEEISDGESFITASDWCLGNSTNSAIESNRSNLVQNDYLENHKNQAECLTVFQDIEDVLCKQLHQLQLTLFEAVSYPHAMIPHLHILQDLPEEETETSLLLAVCTLGSSLVGVQHILTGSIAMMEGVKNPSSLCKMKNTSPWITPASPALSIPTVSEEARTEDGLSDLLLDCTPSDNDLTDLTNLDTPDCQSPVTQNTTSPEIDPFIHGPQEAATRIETPDAEIRLDFHSDFINLFGRRLYASSPTKTSAAAQSRRVILGNLPPGAKLPQIVRGIQTHGQIVNITPLNTLPITNNATKTVMVEFLHPIPAADFIRTIQTTPLIYEDENSDRYNAHAWLVSTASFGLSWVDQEIVSQRYSRSLLLKGFPSDYIWYFINKIGLQHIVRVERDAANDSLCIEFTSLWQARRVDELIWRRKVSDIYQYCGEKGMFKVIVPDVTQISGQIDKSPCGVIKYLPEDDLERYWDTHPYNFPPTHPEKVADQQGPTRLSLQKRLALQHDIEEDEVENLLYDLENHKDTDYKIIGSNITITRRKWSWSMSDEDDTKLLMANTLHEPDWAERWDEYFLNRGEINIRTWEQYGMLARHRRKKAAEQGLGLGAVPKCEKGCEMGCRDIKKTPVATVIKNYLKNSKIRVVGAGVVP